MSDLSSASSAVDELAKEESRPTKPRIYIFLVGLGHLSRHLKASPSWFRCESVARTRPTVPNAPEDGVRGIRLPGTLKILGKLIHTVSLTLETSAIVNATAGRDRALHASADHNVPQGLLSSIQYPNNPYNPAQLGPTTVQNSLPPFRTRRA